MMAHWRFARLAHNQRKPRPSGLAIGRLIASEVRHLVEMVMVWVVPELLAFQLLTVITLLRAPDGGPL